MGDPLLRLSLREAKIDFIWKALYRRNYRTALTRIAYQSLSCLEDDEVEISASITAIVGLNGIGKSTLLAAVAELLCRGSQQIAAGHNLRLSGSSAQATILRDGSPIQISVSEIDGERKFAGEVGPEEFGWIDPSLGTRIVHAIDDDIGFQSVLESLTPIRLDADELAAIAYLTKKSYSACEIYEVSDYGPFDRFPYFRVACADQTYGSERMGQGELSLLLIYWKLRDLPNDSVLILEEPETHVSPHSQNCLMNLLAKFSVEKGIWTVIATQSPTVIRRIPLKHVRLFSQVNGRTRLISAATLDQVSNILGGGVAYRGALLVEDVSAKEFLRNILDELDPSFLMRFEIISVGSESAITAALKSMPRTGSWCTLVGLYDGDQSERLTNVDGDRLRAEAKWPFLFLPGTCDPDQLLRDSLTDSNARERLAELLAKPGEVVHLAAAHTMGCDYHDFVVEFSRFVGLDATVVRRAMTRLWLSTEQNCNLAKTVLSSLHAAANIHEIA